MLVVTDSAAALPDDILAELSIAVVPIGLSVDGRKVPSAGPDETSVPGKTSVSLGRATTSAPTPGDYLSVFERPEAADGCLVITVSGRLSGCLQSATLAAEMTQAPVVVVDSQSAAGGQALVALAGARAVKQSLDIQAAAQLARQVASRVRLIGVLSEVRYLARTGRIPGWAGWAADKAHIKPVFEIRQGEIKRLRPAHSIQSAHRRITERLRQSDPGAVGAGLKRTAGGGAGAPGLHIAVVHAQAPQDAQNLLDAINAEFSPATQLVGSFGEALQAAAGPGVSGLAWWWQDS